VPCSCKLLLLVPRSCKLRLLENLTSRVLCLPLLHSLGVLLLL
jgi:hypothetical protein